MTIALTPSTESTSSIAASIRPWPTPITTISGTAGQSAIDGKQRTPHASVLVGLMP